MPKQLENNGLTVKNASITEKALDFLIQRYTREAGVRTFERDWKCV